MREFRSAPTCGFRLALPRGGADRGDGARRDGDPSAVGRNPVLPAGVPRRPHRGGRYGTGARRRTADGRGGATAPPMGGGGRPRRGGGAGWPRLLRRWAWVVVLVAGWGLYELVREVVLTTRNPNLLPALILLGATVVPAAFVVFIFERRLVFGVHGAAVGVTALLGGVIGVVTAGSLEYRTLQLLGVLHMAGVGLIEEAAKLLVPAAALLVFRQNRHPADGLLLGVASGAGFAVLETMGYAFVALVASRGDLAVVNTVLFDRGLFSPAAHMAWTGLAACALWMAAIDQWRRRSVARFVGVYLLVSILHAAWDSAGNLWIYAGLAVVSLGLLVWTTHRLARPRVPSPVGVGDRAGGVPRVTAAE